MLTYLLALAIVVASAGLYSATFFLPEVSRKNDLAWSGVGLFYGLVLWVCAGRITGGVLLGQMASVGLIGWLGWQVLESRWNATPVDQRVNADKVKGLQTSFSKLQSAVQEKMAAPAETVEETIEDLTDAAATALKSAEKPLSREDFGNPPKTAIDQTAAKPAMKSFSKPSSENPLSGLFEKAKGLTSSLNAPPKNKEVYVRKSKSEVVETPKTETTKAETPQAVAEIDDDFDFGDLETSAETVVETVAETVAETVVKATETIAEAVVEVFEETPETEPLPEIPAKPTMVSLSADEMTAMKPTSAQISADDMTAVKPSVSPIEAPEEQPETPDAEEAVAKSVEIVDEFGDAIVDAVEQRKDND